MVCVYQAVGTATAWAAVHAGLDPGRISFPHVLDAVRHSVATAISLRLRLHRRTETIYIDRRSVIGRF